jgi:hypothetical protein
MKPSAKSCVCFYHRFEIGAALSKAGCDRHRVVNVVYRDGFCILNLAKLDSPLLIDSFQLRDMIYLLVGKCRNRDFESLTVDTIHH